MQRQFKGGIYRDLYVRMYVHVATIMRPYVSVHTIIFVHPLPCGETLMAPFIEMSWLKCAATFRLKTRQTGETSKHFSYPDYYTFPVHQHQAVASIWRHFCPSAYYSGIT